jgi:hypothetical protein
VQLVVKKTTIAIDKFVTVPEQPLAEGSISVVQVFGQQQV